MTEPTLTGNVYTIEETQTYGQKGFRKRLIVLTQKRGQYVNYIPLELIGDACEAADELERGDQISAQYRLSGRRWQRDEASEVRYFLSAEARSFERTELATQPVAAQPVAAQPQPAAAADEQDVPF